MKEDKNCAISIQKLRRAKEKMPAYGEVLELAEKVLSEKCRARSGESDPSFSFDPAESRGRMEAGSPFLRPADVHLSPARMAEYFCRLLKLFQEANPSQYGSLKTILEEKRFSPEPRLRQVLENRLTQEDLEKGYGKAGSLLFFFLVQSLKPQLEDLAQNWRAGLKELNWSFGYCPFCGAFPGMGEIRKEGQRFLHCSLCATEWEYPRLKCVYCGNGDQEELTYFQVEGEPENRVDLCLKCRQYLKTVDSREMADSPDFEVEDYLTLHLDHLAQEEGYTRPAKLFAG